jgi:hypothetical protein
MSCVASSPFSILIPANGITRWSSGDHHNFMLAPLLTPSSQSCLVSSPPPLSLSLPSPLLSGTRSAFNSKFYDTDLTMWSSFRVSDSQLTDAWKLVAANPFSSATVNYLTLWLQSVRAELGKPDVLTRWYAAGIFVLQFICILVSCNVTNKNDTTLIFVTILVCGLNIFLVSLPHSISLITHDPCLLLDLRSLTSRCYYFLPLVKSLDVQRDQNMSSLSSAPLW